MPKTSPFSFSSGVIQDKDTLLVTCQIDEFLDTAEPESQLMRWTRKDETWAAGQLDWTATLVAVDSTGAAIATGPEGRVAVLSPAGLSEEVIAVDDGPQTYGVIRDLKTLGKSLIAVGMGRQAYVRQKSGKWRHIDRGCLRSPSMDTVCGFNAVAGPDERELFAVGFGGEIWTFRNGRWRSVESPTSVILNAAIWAGDDQVFAAGQQGVLLVGSGRGWRLIDHGGPADQFWGMAWFQGHLYLSTVDRLWVLTEAETLEPVEMGLGEEVSCGSLHAYDGVLLSVGAKHICFTDDGRSWRDAAPG